nr:hypothetical protein [Streptomyces mesophilus]
MRISAVAEEADAGSPGSENIGGSVSDHQGLGGAYAKGAERPLETVRIGLHLVDVLGVAVNAAGETVL